MPDIPWGVPSAPPRRREWGPSPVAPAPNYPRAETVYPQVAPQQPSLTFMPPPAVNNDDPMAGWQHRGQTVTNTGNSQLLQALGGFGAQPLQPYQFNRRGPLLDALEGQMNQTGGGHEFGSGRFSVPQFLPN